MTTPHRRAFALVLVFAGALASPACFNPDYPTDLACGPDSFCPSGQICTAEKICISTSGGGVDGGNADGGSGIDSGPRTDAGLGELVAIDIGPALMLALDETHTFVVTAIYENGTLPADNIFIIWTSTDNAIAFVDFMGVARPQLEGTVTITADFEGRLDSAELVVTPAL